MKKPSKNTGVTKSCPDCKKAMIFKANYTGEGTEEFMCKHCGSLFNRTITQKTVITLTKIFLVMFVLWTTAYYLTSNSEIVARLIDW